MQIPTITVQHVVLFLIFIAALSHFVMPLVPRTCGDHRTPCDVNRKHTHSLKFCRRQYIYWKLKLKFLAPHGDHANILITMVELGNKNYAEFRHLVTTQSRCANCNERKIGNAELDRATRAYRSAQNIAKRCTFMPPWNT